AWLMASPQVLGISGWAGVNAHVGGPVLLAIAIVSLWEANRLLRFAGAGLSLWLVIAPIWLPPHAPAAVIDSVVVGLLSAGLAIFPLRARARYGGGWLAFFAT
ncbi:MAG TPA: hypothetical protein V6D47_02465, partial [Oscillatoriaceae cyanobacterium]